MANSFGFCRVAKWFEELKTSFQSASKNINLYSRIKQSIGLSSTKKIRSIREICVRLLGLGLVNLVHLGEASELTNSTCRVAHLNVSNLLTRRDVFRITMQRYDIPRARANNSLK